MLHNKQFNSVPGDCSFVYASKKMSKYAETSTNIIISNYMVCMKCSVFQESKFSFGLGFGIPINK